MVGELLQFPQLRLKALQNLEANGVGSWPNECSSQSCNNKVTPSVLAQRYKFPKPSDAKVSSTMAVAEFQGQSFKTSDLSQFGDACHRNVTVGELVGGNL